MADDTYAQATKYIGRVLDGSTRDALLALLPVLMNKEPLPMADITQALSDLDSAVKGVAARNATDVSALKAEIETLKAAGANTTQLQAVADSIEAQSTALNAIEIPVASATTPAPAPVPAPAAPVVDPVPAPAVDPATGATPVPAPADPVPAPPAP